MAGIYLHIPFCRQKCYYCDFFSVAARKYRQDFLQALHKEIRLRHDELYKQTVHTIYFGGGTPSLLNPEEIGQLLDEIQRCYTVSPVAEITLEANPDDLGISALRRLKYLGITRLSIGIQSFFDEDLRWLNRKHSGEKALRVLQDAIDENFHHISIDLIYGIPGMSDERWKQNLDICFRSEIPHISAYALTVEEKTPLHVKIRKGECDPPDEEQMIRQFRILQWQMKTNGYQQYEISNFCLPGFHSRHNTAYWQGIPYLGLGPSAHSFNGKTRSWNLSELTGYIKGIAENRRISEAEFLSENEKYNEYVMTSLRTMWGCDAARIQQQFGGDPYDHFIRHARLHVLSGNLEVSGEIYNLTDQGMLIADKVTSTLFLSD